MVRKRLRTSLVLIITKVEDPEELDTRFSRFAPDAEESDEDFDAGLDYDDTIVHSTDDVMDLFKKIKKEASDILEKAAQKAEPDKVEEQNDEPAFASKIFSFDSMAAVIRPSVALTGVYDDKNSLYKDVKSTRQTVLLRIIIRHAIYFQSTESLKDFFLQASIISKNTMIV